MNKKTFLKLFSKFRSQAGGIFIGALCAVVAVTGLMTAGYYATSTYQSKMRSYNENVVKYSSTDKKYDPQVNPVEALSSRNKGMVQAAAKDLGPTTIKTTYGGDQYGATTTIIETTGALDLPGKKEQKEKTIKMTYDEIVNDVMVPISVNRVLPGITTSTSEAERDQKTKELLQDNNLPSDKLMVDVTKRVNESYQLQAQIDHSNDLAKLEDMTMKKMDELNENTKEEIKIKDSSELQNSIKVDLNNNNMLQDQQIIEKKRQTNIEMQKTVNIKKSINTFEEYSAITGYSIASNEAYKILNEQFDESKNKVNDIYEDLEDYEVEIISEIEVSTEESDIVDDTSQDDGQQDIQESTTEDGASESGSETTEITEEEVTEDIDTGSEQKEDTAISSKKVITLNGTIVIPEIPPQEMYITIDLNTGNITGILYLRTTISDPDIGTLELNEDYPINGTMDLDTREINCTVGNGFITGELSANGKSASGVTSDGDPWSVSQ